VGEGVFFRILFTHPAMLAGHVARIEERRVSCRVSVGKYEGRRPCGRRRHRSEDNIKIDLEIGWDSVDWIELAQDRDKRQGVMNAATNRDDRNCMTAYQIIRPAC